MSKAILLGQIGLAGDIGETSLEKAVKSEFRHQNEIMTLILDLSYFYQGDIERHLTLYWGHWLGLPGVRANDSRLANYLLRSCCLMAAHFLQPLGIRRSKSLAFDDLIAGILGVVTSHTLKRRYDMAFLHRLLGDRSTMQEVNNAFEALMPLVVVMTGLFVSGKCRESLWQYAEDGETAEVAEVASGSPLRVRPREQQNQPPSIS